jgi:pimeloyl-ACP methyl ester carboxylesterase
VLIHGVTSSSRTWWRVGPWFAERGWHVVAVDLRGHGDSPRMSGGEEIVDLAADVHETVTPLLGPGEHVDVLLGHSLGALTALKLGTEHPGLVRRLVLEDPPDSKGGSSGFDGVAQDVEAGVARAKKDPEAVARNLRAEHPSWTDEDVANDVAGDLGCDAGPVAEMVRNGLRLDLPAMIEALEVPSLLVLGSEEIGSFMLEPERTTVAEALKNGAVEVLETGHSIHRDDFAEYVSLLERWLGEGEPLRG